MQQFESQWLLVPKKSYEPDISKLFLNYTDVIADFSMKLYDRKADNHACFL